MEFKTEGVLACVSSFFRVVRYFVVSGEFRGVSALGNFDD